MMVPQTEHTTAPKASTTNTHPPHIDGQRRVHNADRCDSHRPGRRALVLGALVLGTVAALYIDAQLGRGADEWWNDPHARMVLLQLHFPRAAAALVAGAALAAAGLLIQTVTANPLAAPELLGISPGAVGGVMVGTTMGLVDPVNPLSSLGAALVGALLGGLVGVIATVTGGGDRAILAGLVLAAAATGVSTIILSSKPGLTGMAMRWLAGSTNGVTWESVIPMAVWALPWSILAIVAAGVLPLVYTGPIHAASLGVAPVRMRVFLMGVACLLTAGAVALAGPLGFVGLAIPHIMRRVVGPASPWLVVATLLGGAGGMIACDAVAQALGRLLSFGNNSIGVPAGAVAAISGAVALMMLLRGRQ